MEKTGNCPSHAETPEVWIDVPETDGRYMFSNRGRMRQIARKERHGRKMLTVVTNQIKGVVCDFRTRRMGWYLFLDGEKRFWERDALMRLFGNIGTSVSARDDEEAISRCEKLYRSDFGGRHHGSLGRANGNVYGGAYARP